jgi:glyoxylase-like metal-dependent hydrolase (beta-lactamase superfamily II)
MAAQLQVGNVTVMAVQDAPVSGSRPFMYPAIGPEAWTGWERDKPEYFNPRGNLRMNIGTFVLRSGGRTILVDTGLGEKQREGYPPGTMLVNLQAEGIAAEDVDQVIITHLHIDHVGWNTVEREGRWVPTFPNARYTIVRAEWDAFANDETLRAAPHIQENVLPLADTDRLDLVDGTAVLSDALTLVPSPGHTPAHSCIAIVSGGEKAMIVGDLAHHPVQLTETMWEMAFDMDKALARESRERICERIEAEGGYTIGGHFPPPGFGRLVRIDGRRIWQAL